MINDRYYTDQSMIDWVIAKYAEAGRWPSVRELRNDPEGPSQSLVGARFAGYAALIQAAKLVGGFLTAAELERIQPKQDWVLERLEQKCNQTELRVSRYQISKDLQMPHLRDFAIYCGGIDNALRMLGRPLTFPSHEDLLEMLRESARVLNRTPTRKTAEAGLCGYALWIYLKRYPCWNAVLTAAGLEPNVDSPKHRETLARKRAARQQLLAEGLSA